SALARELAKIGFAELEVVTRGICIMCSDPQPDYKIIPPSEKMKKNGLTTQTNILFSIGLCKHKEVRDYIQHVAIIDPSFPGRLKEGFVTEYKKLREHNFHGDGLFEAMHEFASNGNSDFIQQAAGLAVLTYLFETCEIFEK
ncbi:MAG TPA: HNH endonuclease, partial [Fibrobacteres bacterium]|nr:HNH endonuclease [Fibrobacterota bacterium]